MLQEVLVFDIETSAFKNGVPINIRTDFDSYVEHAKVKWVGAYSYKHNEYYDLNVYEDEEKIKELFKEHKTLVGFNSKAFDYPIMKNNGLLAHDYYTNLDLKIILATDDYLPGFKERAKYMNVTLKTVYVNDKKYGANSLQGMAHAFMLETVKGDIDYKIFFKESWTFDESQEIKKYLRADVEVTKLLFEKTISFWEIFTDWLNEKDIKRWIWINSTIAVMAYFIFCKIKGVEPTFADVKKFKSPMGGRAVEPTDDEIFNAEYLDEVSKYPNTYAEFNLLNEVDVTGKPQWKIDKLIDMGFLFHGNEKFKVRGYYDIRKHGKVEENIVKLLRTRLTIKKILKNFYKNNVRKIQVPYVLEDLITTGELTDDNIRVLKGLEYAIKIVLNAFYGLQRSPIFEQFYTPNSGYDCCWIGQQIHEYIHKRFEDKGFKVVGGFTDSWFIENKKGVNKEEILDIANDCLIELKKYMPFPQDTHTIGYECHIDTIVYSYDAKKQEFKKNNYAFLSNDKIKIVGFPIMKNNASKLSILIFDKYLAKQAITNKRLKFKKSYVQSLIDIELNDNILLSAVTVRCNEAKKYKKMSQLQAQISRSYLDGRSGVLDVIKNTKFGKVGIGEKYCTVEEAIEYGLEIKDLILDKVWNELEPFILKEKMVTLGDYS